ncbi:MAG: RagB/SusD family nutrient uptake outer membrane protein, partial [Bacteroidota bacterium]
MHFINKKIRYFFLISIFSLGCEEALEPEVFSDTLPSNLFSSLEGVEGVLFGAYAKASLNRGNDATAELANQEFMTDISFSTGGGAGALNYIDWILDPSAGGIFYTRPYEAIRNVNIILDELPSAGITEEERTLIQAEARFIRAWTYYILYIRYGPTPLRTSSSDPLEMERADEQEYINFIESEFLEIIPDLPNPGEEKQYGRATNGAAIGLLTKFYLNTQQWQKCADAAQDLMDIGFYALFPSYFGMFQIENEGNSEFVWVRPGVATINREAGMSFMNFAWPNDFAVDTRSGLEFCDGCRNFAQEYRLHDDFYASFEDTDTRTELMLVEYVNTSGDTINILPPNDNVRPFKYWPGEGDPIGPGYGNDIPVIRYADILLSRAEALNELNGPN